jgi:hypothetical protein
VSISRKVNPGEIRQIKAAEWNGMLSLLSQSKQGQVGAIIPSAGGGPWDSNTIIKVRNGTSTAVRQWGVLRYSQPVITPARNEGEFLSEVIAVGTVPSTGDTQVCVLLEPLAPGAIGRAVVAGVVPCRVQALTDTTTPNVAGSGSAAFLRFSNGGLPVLWTGPRDTETNERWCWVFLTPPSTPVVRGGGSNNSVSWNGCDLNECLSEGSLAVDHLSTSEGCKAVPRQYTLEGFQGLGGRGCCEGRIWNDYFSDGNGNATGRPKTLTRTTGTVWESDWFECADLLNQGDDCGDAIWEWHQGVTTITCITNWRGDPVNCSGNNNWVAVGSPGALAWVFVNSTCACATPANVSVPPQSPLPPSYGPTFAGEMAALPCLPSEYYKWRIASNTGGDCFAHMECEQVPPSSPPTSTDDTATTVDCELQVPGEGTWVLMQECRCGTTVAPTTPGTVDMERRPVACQTSIGSGYGGYSSVLTVKWRLTVDGDDAKLELLDEQGTVYFIYKVASPRVWCCLCVNPMVFVGCGPLYRCPPYSTLCIKPVRPEACNLIPDCAATEVEAAFSIATPPQPWSDEPDDGDWPDELFVYHYLNLLSFLVIETQLAPGSSECGQPRWLYTTLDPTYVWNGVANDFPLYVEIEVVINFLSGTGSDNRALNARVYMRVHAGHGRPAGPTTYLTMGFVASDLITCDNEVVLTQVDAFASRGYAGGNGVGFSYIVPPPTGSTLRVKMRQP